MYERELDVNGENRIMRNGTFLKLLTSIVGMTTAFAFAQGISIGRSSLSLRDPQRWEVRNLDAGSPSYSGDKSGDIPMEGKRLVLSSSSGAIKAILLSRVTKGGVPNVRISWANECQKVSASQFFYKRDRATTTDVDCLLVIAVAKPQIFLAALPILRKDLDGQVPEGDTFYYLYFSHSIGSGGYSVSQMLIPQTFKGLDGVTVENMTKIPTGVIAWAEEFATSNRRAIDSFGGNWSVPEMLFPN